MSATNTTIAAESKTEMVLSLDADESKVADILGALKVMNLGPKDFAGCRIAPNGMISLEDAIKVARGCSSTAARLYYSRYIKNKDAFKTERIVICAISHSSGRTYDVPCTSFYNLLRIFAVLPDKKFDPLRSEMALLTTYAASGNLGLAKAVEERNKTIDPNLKEVLEAGAPGAAPVGDGVVASLRAKIEALELDNQSKDRRIASLDRTVNVMSTSLEVIGKKCNQLGQLNDSMATINRLHHHIITARPMEVEHICAAPAAIQASVQMVIQMMALNARVVAARLKDFNSGYRFWDPKLKTILGIPQSEVLTETPMHYTSRLAVRTAIQKIFSHRVANCGMCEKSTINCISYAQLRDLIVRFNKWAASSGGQQVDMIDASIFQYLRPIE